MYACPETWLDIADLIEMDKIQSSAVFNQPYVRTCGVIDSQNRGTSLQRTYWDQLICPLYRGCPLFRGEKCISTLGKSTFGALECVLCREVISMVFFIGSVL